MQSKITLNRHRSSFSPRARYFKGYARWLTYGISWQLYAVPVTTQRTMILANSEVEIYFETLAIFAGFEPVNRPIVISDKPWGRTERESKSPPSIALHLFELQLFRLAICKSLFWRLITKIIRLNTRIIVRTSITRFNIAIKHIWCISSFL